MNKRIVQKKTLIIGVTSGIAVYKSLELVRSLRKSGLRPVVIMTEQATRVLDPVRFEKASGNTVYVKLFERGFDYRKVLRSRKVDHIKIGQEALAFIIAPATANIIAKLAYGIADDFLTTTALATSAPLLIFPSMNTRMWEHPTVKKNIATLKRAGHRVFDPSIGALACGDEGLGRLPDVDIMKKEILASLNQQETLRGLRVLVTAGGTIEPIDTVRHITNKSSGKMGAAIADACYERGARVTLLKARSAVAPHASIVVKEFLTADDLLRLIKTHQSPFDIVYHTAAISDFKVKNTPRKKMPSDRMVTLALEPRDKIYPAFKKRYPKAKVVLFKAEDARTERALLKAGKKKLKESGCDAVVVNGIREKNAGFDSDYNSALIVSRTGIKKLTRAPKKDIADKLVHYLSSME